MFVSTLPQLFCVNALGSSPAFSETTFSLLAMGTTATIGTTSMDSGAARTSCRPYIDLVRLKKTLRNHFQLGSSV